MSQQFNVRLPEITQKQIARLCEVHGLTKTQVVILAVDRLTSALGEQNKVAEKDLRRLQTVARFAPQVDLGQDL